MFFQSQQRSAETGMVCFPYPHPSFLGGFHQHLFLASASIVLEGFVLRMSCVPETFLRVLLLRDDFLIVGFGVAFEMAFGWVALI